MIHAGKVTDVFLSSGNWVFLDIGFSNKRESCGLLFHDEEPAVFQFGKVSNKILEFAAKAAGPVNLAIEAPLSVAFNKLGNPVGRSMERLGAKTRYWYNGLGCAVMVASMYLLRAIHDSCPKQDICLFEGFVSYKNPDEKSNHLRDVELLREVVMNPTTKGASIIAPDSLKIATDHELMSAFRVAGLDFGIPPVIKCDG